ncbi:torsin-4A [Coregonus clupeaformis]|uniref:AAA+ ATPase domain-containing protein n=1 Tax=Coregonus suidteri TaxID=861788 RepID=A0AAN8LZW3_9TELE|nr:torsin-4A [Coregonus clupeaformis]
MAVVVALKPAHYPVHRRSLLFSPHKPHGASLVKNSVYRRLAITYNFKMGDQDVYERLSGSQTDGEMGEEKEGESEGESETRGSWTGAQSFCQFSSSLRAVVRIRQKYQTMKKRRLELAGLGGGGPVVRAGLLTGAPVRTSPKIFTFEGLTPSSSTKTAPSLLQKKKMKRSRRVMFPSGGGCRAPVVQEHSRAKNCLFLLCTILFLQVYNAIENLDDHVLKYDLEGLEKTLCREVFGQQGAMEALLAQLRDYLSTYVHNKPLVLSLHGPSGVGKSHIGRLLAGHFRSVVGEPLVLQYFVLHHCPLEDEAWRCARALTILVSETVLRAEEEEKIPVFIFDEAEHLHPELLDALRDLVQSKRSNEYLNAVYLFLSNQGHNHITMHLLHNSSSDSMMRVSGYHGNLVKELTPLLQKTLEKLHPLWADAELLPLTLLEKGHVTECFLDEMTREGFYPDHTNIERLAGEIEYYPVVGGRVYARTGCKQVVAKVNLL